MELKSKKYYDTVCSTKLNSFISGEQDFYNEIISNNSNEKANLSKYVHDFISSYSNTSNSAIDLNSSLQNVYNLLKIIGVSDNNTLLESLENELKTYHIRLKCFLDTLIISIASCFVRLLHHQGNKLNNLVKYSKIISPDIITHINFIDAEITKYDDGKRNKIVHEGSFQDDMIDDLRIFFITGKKIYPNDDDYRKQLNINKQLLIIKKYVRIDRLNFILYNKFVVIHDLLTKSYYDKRNELS